MKRLTLIFIITILLNACQLLGINPGLEKISFKPTQCANPWDNTVLAAPNPTTEQKFKAYLFTAGISLIDDFKITTDTGIYCEACICVGSETYHFKIKKDELNLLKTLEPFDNLNI